MYKRVHASVDRTTSGSEPSYQRLLCLKFCAGIWHTHTLCISCFVVAVVVVMITTPLRRDGGTARTAI